MIYFQTYSVIMRIIPTQWMTILPWWIQSKSTAFAATSLAASLMHKVFMFYYVRVFLELYHIQEVWFQWAQVLYMVWNSLNDPLFGYCQDNCNVSIVKSRRHTILYGAPLFALSFLVPWFPWVHDYQYSSLLCGVHLIVALCFYDAMFTWVLLANCCLFAEMSAKSEERIRMLKYSQIAGLLGSFSVFFTESVSTHLADYAKFQMCCIFIGVLACLCMLYTGVHGATPYDLGEVHIHVLADTDTKEQAPAVRSGQKASNACSAWAANESMWRQTWQILSYSNFLWFVLVNLLNEYHFNFVANFSSIISDMLVPKDHAAEWVWSVYYGAVVSLPGVSLSGTR